MRFYWKYVRIILPFFIFSVLCMCVESGVELIQPTLLSNILDVGVANGDFSYVVRTSGIMLLAVLFYAAAAFARNLLSTKGSQWFAFHMRADVYKKIQSLTPDELNRFGAGTLMTRVTNDITQLQNMTMGLMRVCIKAPILCVGGILMAWRLNARLALIPIISTIVIFCLIAINIRYGFPLFSKVQAALDRVNTVIREYLSGVRVVKAFNRFSFELNRFDTPNEELRRTSTFASRIMAIFNPTVTIIIYAGIVFIYWNGGMQVDAGTMHTGQIIAFVSYMTQILQSLNMFSNIFQRIVRSKASAQRLTEIMDAESLKIPSVPLKLDEMCGIEFENVTFSYKNATGRPALHNVTFSCGVGERVGVIGATGSGKTTLISLILQFYEPTAGQIRIFGADSMQSDPKEVRQLLSVVPQRVMLFTGTIGENIRWGREDATDDDIRAAARTAHADDFISNFHDGYDTLLGHSGVNLSGGQRQRVAIARALIKRPRILILDDCLSAVDALTEASIRDALREVQKTCGCLLVSQKISSIADCDKILVLDDGEGVGFGTHDELLESCSVYRDIYLSQYGADALQNAGRKVTA
ncbi:MAG: ABC transporter ATP-binding protein [Clostridiaceae bacterium]|nr:ABC transporter ATP-binding protein [Clostridiaceae bacterium]